MTIGATCNLDVTTMPGAAGLLDLNYIWESSNPEVIGVKPVNETDPRSAILTPLAFGTATITCHVSDLKGSTGIDTVLKFSANVNSVLLTISEEPEDALLTPSSPAAVLRTSAEAALDTEVFYQWYLAEAEDADGVAIEGANAEELPVIYKEGVETEYYYCVASAANCEDVTSRTAKVTYEADALPNTSDGTDSLPNTPGSTSSGKSSSNCNALGAGMILLLGLGFAAKRKR
jgi:hypothetical protein